MRNSGSPVCRMCPRCEHLSVAPRHPAALLLAGICPISGLACAIFGSARHRRYRKRRNACRALRTDFAQQLNKRERDRRQADALLTSSYIDTIALTPLTMSSPASTLRDVPTAELESGKSAKNVPQQPDPAGPPGVQDDLEVKGKKLVLLFGTMMVRSKRVFGRQLTVPCKRD